MLKEWKKYLFTILLKKLNSFSLFKWKNVILHAYIFKYFQNKLPDERFFFFLMTCKMKLVLLENQIYFQRKFLWYYCVPAYIHHFYQWWSLDKQIESWKLKVNLKFGKFLHVLSHMQGVLLILRQNLRGGRGHEYKH